MASLTSLLPRICVPLGLSSAALYERQRALIRIGLLPSAQGRGKGSGAKAAPETVALLVISRLLTDNLSDVDDRVRDLANATLVDRKRKTCQWTGARNFHDAVSALLRPNGPGEPNDRAASISVWRDKPTGGITILPSHGGTSYFGGLSPAQEADFFEVVHTEAELPDGAIRLIRRELADHTGLERSIERSRT